MQDSDLRRQAGLFVKQAASRRLHTANGGIHRLSLFFNEVRFRNELFSDLFRLFWLFLEPHEPAPTPPAALPNWPRFSPAGRLVSVNQWGPGGARIFHRLICPLSNYQRTLSRLSRPGLRIYGPITRQ